jgi:hypothetical protein
MLGKQYEVAPFLFGWEYIRAEPFSFFVWFGSAPEQQQQQHHSGAGWTFY